MRLRYTAHRIKAINQRRTCAEGPGYVDAPSLDSGAEQKNQAYQDHAPRHYNLRDVVPHAGESNQ